MTQVKLTDERYIISREPLDWLLFMDVPLLSFFNESVTSRLNMDRFCVNLKRKTGAGKTLQQPQCAGKMCTAAALVS